MACPRGHYPGRLVPDLHVPADGMRVPWSRPCRTGVLALALVGAHAMLSAVAAGAAADDSILPLPEYRSETGRRLAEKYATALRELDQSVAHCLPWVEVEKHTIGFFKPKHVPRDERYVSIRAFVGRDASAKIAMLDFRERAAAMFARYAGPLLRRMGADRSLLQDADVYGFAIILDWTKPAPVGAGVRPVRETIAVFVERRLAVEYLQDGLSPSALVTRAAVFGFDGDIPIGQVRLLAVADHLLPVPGTACSDAHSRR